MLATQLAVFVAMVFTRNPWLFGAMVCYVLLCYAELGRCLLRPGRVRPQANGRRVRDDPDRWSAAGVAGLSSSPPSATAFPLGTGEGLHLELRGRGGFLAIGAVLSLLLSNRPMREEARPSVCG